LELRVLGPIEVRHDGSPVKVRGTKPRQLLALLAIRPNRAVTAEQLVDELWEGNPPPSASTALRVHIRRLREALELDRAPNSPSARLPASPQGYVLRIEPDELDAQHFERLVLLARDAIDGGNPVRAVPLLTQALDLWRGEALADIAELAAARSEVARLDDLRAVAIEELADARLELGEHALVVDLVRSALMCYPLRERLTASLMLALYRSRRQAEALQTYSDLARRLDAELGVAPTPALRRLEEDVLLQRPNLDGRAARIAPSASHTRTPIGRFVGRRAEVGEMLDTLDGAADGTSRLVLVRGEAGIGKTTLIEEFCARAERAGARPLVGHCSVESSTSYQPVVDILRQLVSRVAPAERASLPSQLGLVLSDLVDPTLGDGTEGAHRAQFRLFEAIATTVAALSERPRVLIVEDLHWADRPTLRLLRHLLRHRSLDSTVVIATYRNDDIDGERSDAIEHLTPSLRRAIIELQGFDDHEVRALVRATAPPETMHTLLELAATLHDVTSGNPFFLRELLREFDEQLAKLDDPHELSQTLQTIAPVGIRALVDRRLARLSDNANRVLRAAAVVGHELDINLLAGICEMPKESTLEAIEETLAARVLIEDYKRLDCYQFPHALVRNAVYASIPIQARAQLHRSAAEALEQVHANLAGQLADIAFHYTEAAPLGLHAEAARYSEQAGNEAAARYAFADAARWYQTAVEQYHSADAPHSVLGRAQLALGSALANDKRREAARSALAAAAERARSARDPRLFAEVALTADNSWALGADFQPDVLALLEEALTAVGDSDEALRVRLLESIATNLYYIDDEREGEVVHSALELAERINRPMELASAYRSLHLWYSHQPEARAERLACARRAYELACSAPGAVRLRLIAHRGLIVDLLENQEIEEFAQNLEAYDAAAEELGSPAEIYWAMALHAAQATMHGDLAVADQLARGALLRGHELDQISDGAYFLQRFVIRYLQARLCEEIPALAAAAGVSTVYRAGAALHAVGLAETGQHDRALDVTWSAIGSDGSSLPKDAFWLAGMSLFAGVAAKLRDRTLAQVLQPLLEPCADHVVLFGAGAAILGSGHHWLGGLHATLGNVDASLEHFSEATLIAQRLRAPYWEAQSKVDAAAVLRSRSRCADAAVTPLLTDAVAIAERQGYQRILIQAQELH